VNKGVDLGTFIEKFAQVANIPLADIAESIGVSLSFESLTPTKSNIPVVKFIATLPKESRGLWKIT
jgi:hypothetical protein